METEETKNRWETLRAIIRQLRTEALINCHDDTTTLLHAYDTLRSAANTARAIPNAEKCPYAQQ